MYRITFENSAGVLDVRVVPNQDQITGAVMNLIDDGNYPMQPGDVIRVTETE